MSSQEESFRGLVRRGDGVPRYRLSDRGGFAMRGARHGLFALLGCMALVCGYAGHAMAQAPGKDGQKCINAMNKNLQKVAATAGKEASACVKNATKGKESDPYGCLSADAKGKVAKAMGKTGPAYTKNCTVEVPAFGVTDPNTVNQVAQEKEFDLVARIFGHDLAEALADPANKNDGKCQQTAIKDAAKCQDTYMKTFNGEKKSALKAGSVSDASGLAALLGNDPKGKIGKACGKIATDIGKKCGGTESVLSDLFPGCGTDDQGELASCLESAAKCTACRAIARADGLLVSEACPDTCALGLSNCHYDSRAWCIGGDNDGDPCTDPLQNSDCPGGGNCLSLARTFLYSSKFPDGIPVLDIGNLGKTVLIAGAPDPVTGVADLICSQPVVTAVNMGTVIGVACIQDYPVPGCGFGQIDCDGGSPMDVLRHNFHGIGNCGLLDDPNETDPNNLTGPEECQAMCESYCAGVSGNFSYFNSGVTGCEGYCNGGDLDGSWCDVDIGCLVLNPSPPPTYISERSGTCVGGNPVVHTNQCICECIEIGGAPSAPGTYWCTSGLVTTVEPDEPCDGINPSQVTLSCGVRGSGTTTNVTLNAEAVEGKTLTMPTEAGVPITCEEMAQGDLGALNFVGSNVGFDGGLGDMFQAINIECKD
jgi:hypothetical protein